MCEVFTRLPNLHDNRAKIIIKENPTQSGRGLPTKYLVLLQHREPPTLTLRYVRGVHLTIQFCLDANNQSSKTHYRETLHGRASSPLQYDYLDYCVITGQVSTLTYCYVRKVYLIVQAYTI